MRGGGKTSECRVPWRDSPRSIEQGKSHYAGHVCFISRLTGLSTIHDRPDITTMQEESKSSMIAPLSDGNAQSIDSSTEATVVKDEPHAGAKADKGGPSPSPRPQGPAGVSDVNESSMPSAGAMTGKGGSSRSPRPQGTAGKGDGDESLSLSRRLSAEKKKEGGRPRPPRPAGKGNGMSRRCRRCRNSRGSRRGLRR